MKNKRNLLNALMCIVALSLVSCTTDPKDSNSSVLSENTSELNSTSSEASSSTNEEISSMSEESSDESEESSLPSEESSLPSEESSQPSEESSSSEPVVDEEYITIAEAIKIANAAGDTLTTEKYLIKGTIKEVSNPTYGAMTVVDETGELFIYGVYASDETTRYDALEEKPVAGDEVVLLGALKTYKGTPEMDRGYIQSFVHNIPVVDPSQYATKSIADARVAVVNDKIILNGVVTFITYANGMNPNGFYLTDGASSIYVYGSQVAQQVEIGNTVSVAGTKTYYVLDTEKSNAEKWGYKGCCQLADPILLNNAKDHAEIDLSWATETTIKAILENPVTEDITTNIYKVNALVHRSEGGNFVNYYFNDIDGVTGSYAYTSNNGNDFAYLDQYDGKICTVYISPINCKSTATGCTYRFVPIRVEDNGFTLQAQDAPKFALDYYANGQFFSSYASDPALPLLTSVSSELLKVENITLSYASDNTDVVYFEEEDGNVTFHTNNSGKAAVTVTASYGEYVCTSTINIEVVVINAEYISVAEAISAEDNTEVVVKGVVTSSVVNKNSSFYLTDETGIIVVSLKSVDDIALLSLGNEVIVKGTKSHFRPESCAGQIFIDGAEIVVNNYGNHEYSTTSFVTEDFANIAASAKDVTADLSAKGYITEVVVTKTSSMYPTFILTTTDGSGSIQLYSSSAAQYSFLEQFVGQTVTVELALCNWNAKKDSFRGCVIAVYTEDGKIINSLNFN